MTSPTAFLKCLTRGGRARFLLKLLPHAHAWLAGWLVQAKAFGLL